jgi:hypothetical protein
MRNSSKEKEMFDIVRLTLLWSKGRMSKGKNVENKKVESKK